MKRKNRRRRNPNLNNSVHQNQPTPGIWQSESGSTVSGVGATATNGNHQKSGQAAATQVKVIPAEHVEVIAAGGSGKEEPKKNGAEQKKTFRARLKSYFWRLTASYLWLYLIVMHIGHQSWVVGFKSELLRQVVTGLSSIGFAPVNEVYLPTVFKIGWLILITAFNPFELFLGFWLYAFIGFPCLVIWSVGSRLWRLIFRGKKTKVETVIEQAKEETKSNSTKKSGKGLRRPKWRSRFQVYTLSFLALLAWFLLFGGATSRGPLVLGAVITGWVFWLSMMRLFGLAKITTESPTALHNMLRKASGTLFRIAEGTIKNPFTNQQDLDTSIRMHKFIRWVTIRLARIIRSAKDKVPGLVLSDYGLSLVLVGTTAVLFWALVIKSALLSLTLADSLYLSVSYFLPNIHFEGGSNPLPTWADIGLGATAFILFVLYIGPVVEVVPDRQKHARERFIQTFRVYRDDIRKLKKSQQRLKHIVVKK